MKNYKLAIVGATGVVGRCILKVLEEKNLPISKYVLFASSKSAGKQISFMKENYTIQELTEDSFCEGFDFAIFSAGASVAKKFAPIAVKNGCVVIDNSSAFRMDCDVPLIVPEVNSEDIKANKGIIANPNCSTIQAVVALKPLDDKYNIKSKTNKPLAGTVIGRIIRNPKYKGYFCAHKETTVDYHSKKRIRFKPEEWIVYKDNETCPPIVSEELWEKCNEILNKNSHKHKTHTRTDMRYALSGKIKCYHDGATFVKGGYKNKRTGLMSKYWGCSNYRKYGKEKFSYN